MVKKDREASSLLAVPPAQEAVGTGLAGHPEALSQESLILLSLPLGELAPGELGSL